MSHEPPIPRTRVRRVIHYTTCHNLTMSNLPGFWSESSHIMLSNTLFSALCSFFLFLLLLLSFPFLLLSVYLQKVVTVQSPEYINRSPSISEKSARIATLATSFDRHRRLSCSRSRLFLLKDAPSMSLELPLSHSRRRRFRHCTTDPFAYFAAFLSTDNHRFSPIALPRAITEVKQC